MYSRYADTIFLNMPEGMISQPVLVVKDMQGLRRDEVL